MRPGISAQSRTAARERFACGNCGFIASRADLADSVDPDRVVLEACPHCHACGACGEFVPNELDLTDQCADRGETFLAAAAARAASSWPWIPAAL